MKNEDDHAFVTRIETRARGCVEATTKLSSAEYARLHHKPYGKNWAIGVYRVSPTALLMLCEDFKLKNVLKKLG